MTPLPPLGLRWTVGDVSARGFRALRLSLLGARRVFGPAADLAVVVNSLPPEEARRRTGAVPAEVRWLPAGDLPEGLRAHLDAGMAEGVAWKLAPLRLFPDRWELAFDNDLILWSLPDSLRGWLASRDAGRCVLAADVERALGAFDTLCGPLALNTGIRGFPPGYDLEAALLAVLARNPVPLRSELDEQGLQVAAMQAAADPVVVGVEEVSICSPFWPKRPELGTAGAHFVGLNARNLPWDWYGRPASDCQNGNFDRWEPVMAARVGA
ncbi:hypothetical protein [Rhodospirillum centenum]|uniref:Uncharacterized protein n=1 Tax=Rhodospirillum centenum (strain ATCC 51521 / SW) TaxID=414684 RepID=B6IRX2_RHOCS|nr:hypothetical protein [Rhodospirillum centenum]ACI98208.1 hypothetical protein RC1_0777 [Rhodospirillum centenum SW]